MRTIKFRAWDGQEMIYPDDYKKASGKHLTVSEILSRFENVMQFTGLHDKNGREIYEGDILELEESMGMGQIRKRKEVVTFDDDVVDEYGAWIAGWFIGESKHKRLVIGNIHENPDLI
jgi:uncharacterized phage protein (TIGR01671 family)